jgi:2-keto-4-pentenoate hydratase
MQRWILHCCLLLVGLSGPSCVQAAPKHSDIEIMVARVVLARNAGDPAPVLSSGAAEPLATATAYHVQTKAVKTWLASQSPIGFKAGLTSAAGQKKFAVNQPVAGVLLPGSQLKQQGQGYTVDRRQFNRAMMEAEIGFRFKNSISTPITNIKTLKANVAAVLPVIELPDLAFDKPAQLKGADIIANNVAAKHLIAGTDRDVKGIDINALSVNIKKDGKSLLQGQGRDAMGDQWRALLWLVNQTVASGWEIQPGQLLITGALGKMLPAEAGAYQVDFGELGQLGFTVQ